MLRSALVLAVALCSGIVPLLHAAHDHEPCHRGLHAGPPHETGTTLETCAVCRTSPLPGAAPAPTSWGLGLVRRRTPFLVTASRGPAAGIRLAFPPRAPPSLHFVQA